jgi:hypothetical protein
VLQYFNVFTLNSQNPVNILNGSVITYTPCSVGCNSQYTTFTNAVVNAINSASATTLYYARSWRDFVDQQIDVVPCVKFSVSSIGSTGDTLQSISLRYLSNGDPNISESEFEILPTAGVAQVSGDTTSVFASRIASTINSFAQSQNTTTNNVTNSSTITVTGPLTAKFVVGNRISNIFSTNPDNPSFYNQSVYIKSILGTVLTLERGYRGSGNLAAVTVLSGTVLTATTDVSAVAVGSDVIIRPDNFVQSLNYQQNTTRLVFTYKLPDYPILAQINSSFLNGGYQLATIPVVQTIPTTGVVSSVDLSPIGSGASINVSINSITSTINGATIASTGSDYQYPPRVTITAPNTLYPTIQVTSYTSTASINTINVVQTNSTTVELLKGTSIGAPTSLADAASKIVAGINAKTSQSGYSAAISAESNDTVVLYPPSGIRVKQINISTSGYVFNFIVPTQALASVGVTTSSVIGYTIVESGSGYTTAPAVTIKSTVGSGASAVAVIDENGIGSVAVTSGGSGYPSILNIKFIDASGSGSGATGSVKVVNGSITEITVLTPGKGYIQPQIVPINPNGSQMGVGAQFSFTKTGVVTNVNPVTEGTGYTSPPTVTLQPSTGIFVQFSSTGTLPSPIVQGNVYRAENPSSGSSFTLKNNDFTEVNITSTGSGTIYLVLSRAFSIGFTGNWAGEFAGISTATIRLQTDYQLPVTAPSTDTQTAYTLTKVSDTRAIIRTVSPVVQVIPTQLGVGQSYFAIPVLATVNVYNNQILPSSTQYLTSGMTVQFSSSSGTLPAPLALATDYKIYPSGKVLTVKTVGGSNIVFTSLGNSQLYMNIIRQFTPKPATTVIVNNCIFETGDKISVRPSTGDTLPSPLQNTSTYYVSRAGDDLIRICSSAAAAIAGNPVSLYSIGNTVDSQFIIDSIKDPTLVRAIYHIQKPLTLGYVSLYAFDYGRSNDMALIGQYHPSEVNPKYRRIRIGKPCAWVRMAYRVKPVDVASDADYIPLENERAVLTALHAIDLEDKDFVEQSQRYWGVAYTYLKQETESMDGHAMQVPQINNLVYGDGSDPIVN